jgi:hypothetical protein
VHYYAVDAPSLGSHGRPLQTTSSASLTMSRLEAAVAAEAIIPVEQADGEPGRIPGSHAFRFRLPEVPSRR